MQKMPEGIENQPLSKVHWVSPEELYSNDYNPNKVFKPELALLKESLMATGWTQPVVATPEGEIIDGFHRYTLASTDPEVAALGGGKLPVVFVDAPREQRMMATVRHNRARGQHGILKMGDIVRELLKHYTREEVLQGLGMESEELDRLANVVGSPELAGKDSFGRGWVPTR